MEGEGKKRDVEKERYCLPEGYRQGRRVIGEAAGSGVSIHRFCQQRKLKGSQFYWWQRTLKERQASG